MNKLAKIRLRTGQEYYLNEEERNVCNAFYKFCSDNFTKIRDDNFYKEFLEYLKIMKNKETLIKNVIGNGSMMDIVELTSYVNSHEDEFKIEDRIVYLNIDKGDISVKDFYTLKEIISILESSVRFFYYIYAVKNIFGNIQYYVNIHEGKNGNGNFLLDDMTIVYTTMLKMNTFTSWVSLTDMSADIPDDVSTWGITFTL